MVQEEKVIRMTDFFRTTQSSDVDGAARQQTTSSLGVPSATAAPSQRPTTVKDLKSPDAVTDRASEAEEVQLVSPSYRKNLFSHVGCALHCPLLSPRGHCVGGLRHLLLASES